MASNRKVKLLVSELFRGGSKVQKGHSADPSPRNRGCGKMDLLIEKTETSLTLAR